MKPIRRTALTSLALSALLLNSACAERAVTNMQTLTSSDCGRNWKLISAGDSIPRQMLACDLRVSIPNYPMQGGATFKVNFKNRVLVSVNASYEYTITDALKFIRNARYVGQQNSAADGAENGAGVYETAENLLIDRRMREIASDLLREEDIVSFDSSAFEDRLLEALNKSLEERGVQLNSIAFVPTPDVQTRQAIDAGAAIRVYDAIGLADLGKQMMVARAGASTVTQSNTAAAPNKEE
jgi:uncharacterized membrane protein